MMNYPQFFRTLRAFSGVIAAVYSAIAIGQGDLKAEACRLQIDYCKPTDCSSYERLDIGIPISEEYDGKYDRGSFSTSGDRSGWSDEDGDCQDTRTEILVETSLIPVVFGGSNCWVVAGLWYDEYSGRVFESPGDIDIDHVVALKEAHESGAYRWTSERRSRFANDYQRAKNLHAIWNSTNRSKGALEPHQWLPPRTEASCGFVERWAFVKWFWTLSVDHEECAFLVTTLENCNKG